MDRYVDGYVLPVATDDLDAYRELATEAGELWMDSGALAYFECVGDDLAPEMPGDVQIRQFSELVDAGPDETVVFAFVVFESREHRDEVNQLVMEDPSMQDADAMANLPFDAERMTYGGFRALVGLEDF